MTSWAVHPLRERKRGLEVTQFGPGPLPGRFLKTPATGPHAAVLRAVIPVERSQVEVSYVLAAGSVMLEIHLKVRWLEDGNDQRGIPGLRLRVSHALAEVKTRYEVPFGHVGRDCPGQTVPAVGWADVTGKLSDGQAGLAILNHGQHGHLQEDDGSMAVTLLRSSYDPDPLPELGDHQMRLAVVPHDGSLTAAELTALSAQFAAPMETAATDVHEGRFGPVLAGVESVEPAGVVLTGIKKCEDDEALLVRLLNTTARVAAARVKLNPDLLGNAGDPQEVDLLERALDGGASLSGTTIKVKIPPCAVASVKVRVGG